MALAMISNAKGYSLTTPLSNQIPLEKRTVLRLAGVDVVELEDSLCPAPGAPEGAIAKAHEIAGDPEFEMLNQYKNMSNPEAHYRTTGPEIWHQTAGNVTHLIAGLGTCGTINGTGRFLKEQGSDVQVLGVHPAPGHDIPGMGTPAAKGTKQEQLLAGMIENARTNPNLVTDVESAHELWQDRKPLVIDVREPDAHRLRHIPGALNVPLGDLADLVPFLPEDLDAPLLSVCEQGNLSLSGVLFLNSLGYRRARSITGGTQAWSERGFTTDSTAERFGF